MALSMAETPHKRSEEFPKTREHSSLAISISRCAGKNMMATLMQRMPWLRVRPAQFSTHCRDELAAEFPVIVVDDTLLALHRLAAAWRDRLALRVVCITGSSGKTSTKEFTAAVLSIRYRVVKTEGNLNNHIGLPLSILSASISDDAAVWEIGMNHPGEIAPLARLARRILPS